MKGSPGWFERSLRVLTQKLTGVRLLQLSRIEPQSAPIEKVSDFPILVDASRWLDMNRTERMDALDTTGIFPPDRQAFHRARYEFALPYVTNLEVADIACGLGYGCRILKQGGAKTVVGIDSCKDAVDYARAIHQPAGVRFECADATRTALPSLSMEMITCFETIEHVPNTTELLSEFARILKPPGQLIISSPNDWGLTQHHCHSWTPFEFMTEVAAHFEIESIWEQYSFSAGQNYRHPLGIKAWAEETEAQAECLIIVARKKDARD